MTDKVEQESLMVPVSGTVQLHLRRIWSGTQGTAPPVLLLHGAAEDGHIFYSHSGRGLACWLAKNGYEAFVPDLRGKAKSWPAIDQNSSFGFHEIIRADLPALAATVNRLSNGQPQTWISHSMGGVLAAAAILRAGREALGVHQLVHFATRRQARAPGWQRRFYIDFLWNRIGRLAVAFEGYLPAPALRLGTSRESARCFHDGLSWSRGERWRDTEDGFDYSTALERGEWLRSLYFAAAADRAFGAPEDVRDFMHEMGRHDGRLIVLGKAEGNLQDYTHTGMLLHPDAEQDHFPQLLGWLRERSS